LFINQKAENIIEFLQEIFREKKLFNHLLLNKTFNEIFDILLDKYKEAFIISCNSFDDDSANIANNSKIILNRIVLIITKINETIISDLKLNPAASEATENKAVKKSNSDLSINNNIHKFRQRLQQNENNIYFEDIEAEESQKIAEELNEESSGNSSNLTEIYLSFLDIYEKCLPAVLDFYANTLNRPKRRIASTYRNCETDILGISNLAIVELIKSFLELMVLNSKLKAFGYKSNKKNMDADNHENSFITFIIEEKFEEKLRSLFAIMFKHNFFKVCLNDLLKYEMNNHLQILVRSIFGSVFDYASRSDNCGKISSVVSETEMGEGKSSNKVNFCDFLIANILVENSLLDFIIFNSLDKCIEFENTEKAINSGFTPCLVEIAEKINDAKTENRMIKDILDKSKFELYFCFFYNFYYFLLFKFRFTFNVI